MRFLARAACVASFLATTGCQDASRTRSDADVSDQKQGNGSGNQLSHGQGTLSWLAVVRLLLDTSMRAKQLNSAELQS